MKNLLVYSHETDLVWAQWIVQTLDAKGFKTEQRPVVPQESTDFLREMARASREVDLVLLVVSPELLKAIALEHRSPRGAKPATLDKLLLAQVKPCHIGGIPTRETLFADLVAAQREEEATHDLLGMVSYFLREYEVAREHIERLIQLHEARLGATAREVAADLICLGGILRAKGDLEGARACYERVVSIEEAVYGPAHTEVADSLSLLGRLSYEQKSFSEARSCHERALAIDQATYGPVHREVGLEHFLLGKSLKGLKDFDGAREHFKRALTIDLACYGPEHPEVAEDLGALGAVLAAKGDLAGARSCYERALTIFEKNGTPKPCLRLSLGELFEKQRDLIRAQKCYEDALAEQEALPSPEPIWAIILLFRVGSTLQRQRDPHSARERGLRALALSQRAYGPDSLCTGRCLERLGAMLDALGDRASARECYAKALQIFLARRGEKDPTTLSLRRRLEQGSTTSMHDERPRKATKTPPEVLEKMSQITGSPYAARIRELVKKVKKKVVASSVAGRSGYLLRFEDGAFAAAYLSERRLELQIGVGEAPEGVLALLNAKEAEDGSRPLPLDVPYANERCEIAEEVAHAHGKPITGVAIGETSFNFCFPEGRELDAMVFKSPEGRPVLRVFWEQW